MLTRTQPCREVQVSSEGWAPAAIRRVLRILENRALIALQFIKIHQRYMRPLQGLGLIYVTVYVKWDRASRPWQICKTDTTQSKCTSRSMGCSSWSAPNIREINSKRKKPTRPKNMVMTSLVFKLDPSRTKNKIFFSSLPVYFTAWKNLSFHSCCPWTVISFLFSLWILYI